MSSQKREIPAGCIGKKTICEGFGISPQGLGKWGLAPAGKIGRENYYRLEDVAQKWAEKRGGSETAATDDDDREAAKKLARDRSREEYLLAKERRIGQQQKNEIQAGTVIPTEFATWALSKVAAQVATILDTLPLTMKRNHPDLEPRHIDALTREVAKARNKAAEVDELLPDMVEEYVESISEAD